jgi:hypothetical protein
MVNGIDERGKLTLAIVELKSIAVLCRSRWCCGLAAGAGLCSGRIWPEDEFCAVCRQHLTRIGVNPNYISLGIEPSNFFPNVLLIPNDLARKVFIDKSPFYISLRISNERSIGIVKLESIARRLDVATRRHDPGSYLIAIEK